MENQKGKWAEQVKVRTKQLMFWTFGWVITLAIATFGHVFMWESKAITAISIIINVLFGVGMIVANKRHLEVLDELEKKIHLEAMGLALGVGIVGGLSFSLLDQTNIISGDAEIGFLVMAIGITYMITLVIGKFRYS